MSKRVVLSLVVGVMAGVMVVPGLAFGVYSYDEKDYSFDYNAKTQVAICDKESDGNGAFAKYRPNGVSSDQRLNDPNGASSGCGYSGGFSRIYSHQACEDLNLRPDHCGTRVYP